MTSTLDNTPTGHLAYRELGLKLPVAVMRSAVTSAEHQGQ